MIRFDNVSKQYVSGQNALNAVSFEIAKGEMAFITGHSGAGKSSLLKLILAAEKSTAGSVIVNGSDLSKLRKRDVPFLRRRIGSVFQDHQLLQDRTVADNVALPLDISGFDRRDAQRRVRAALDKVGLSGKEKQYPAALSSGEQQRVGIARAVVNRPAIILADEPTGNLDPELSAEIMAVFEQFKNVGVSLLIASHDISLINQMDYRTLVLKEGQLIGDTGRGES
ncbi:MAG: cell division ATP-binding protein FtsE [Gammaproteobacteria bacterium]|nr:cell division ATP-binding protein FtsE [Gammaproteobacteria bacterium]